VTEEIRLAQHE